MKTRKVASDRVLSCQAIIGAFIFGPAYCGKSTDLVEDETGDDFPVCEEHALLDSGLKGIPR